MSNDPIVEDVHRARQRILAECEGDLRRWLDRLKSAEARHSDRLVSLEEVLARKARPVSSETHHG